MHFAVERNELPDQLDDERALLGGHILHHDASIRDHGVIHQVLYRASAEGSAAHLRIHILGPELRGLFLLVCQRGVDGVGFVALRLHDAHALEATGLGDDGLRSRKHR